MPPWEPLGIDTLSEPDDAALVAAVATGDQTALETAYRRHGDAAFGLARRLLAERALAEEVVQEVFLRLWNRPERYDPDRGSLRSFLLAQVHGRSVDLLRSEIARRNREERDARREAPPRDDPESVAVGRAQAETVRAALDALPAAEREAIELAYFGGHTYREVSRLLDQPEGTVKSRIRSGLARLRATLAGAGVEP